MAVHLAAKQVLRYSLAALLGVRPASLLCRNGCAKLPAGGVKSGAVAAVDFATTAFGGTLGQVRRLLVLLLVLLLVVAVDVAPVLLLLLVLTTRFRQAGLSVRRLSFLVRDDDASDRTARQVHPSLDSRSLATLDAALDTLDATLDATVEATLDATRASVRATDAAVAISSQVYTELFARLRVEPDGVLSLPVAGCCARAGVTSVVEYGLRQVKSIHTRIPAVNSVFNHFCSPLSNLGAAAYAARAGRWQ